MGTLYIKNKFCPFCGKKLINNFVNCTQYVTLQCLECEECKIYLYTERNYNILKELATNRGRKLNHDVYKYQLIEPKVQTKDKKSKNKQSKTQMKSNKKTKTKVKMSTTSLEIQTTRYNPLTHVNLNKINCTYLNKKHCTYMDDDCRPYSLRCKLKLVSQSTKKSSTIKQEVSNTELPHIIPKHNTDGVIVIVLSDNRRCIYNNHNLVNTYAVCKVVTKNGVVKEVKILSAYCENCNQYIVLKTDFNNAKKIGTLLCIVEDHTYSYLQKHKTVNVGNESKIHQLGYNVIQGYAYSDRQRQIILANIIENTKISQQEILSIIDANIARHKNQDNYAKAVNKWIMDREFVSQYNLGDCPEVVFNNIILKYKNHFNK